MIMTAIDGRGARGQRDDSLIRSRFLGAGAGDPTAAERSAVGANGAGTTGAKATFPAEPDS